jgi:hypothetical protein
VSMTTNPFAVLGLPERPDLDDETVRAAWRQIAAATHPDREDGGDLARYTQASAAYEELRDAWGRSEAYADLVERAHAEGRWDAYPGRFPGFEVGHPKADLPEIWVATVPPFWFGPLVTLLQLPGRILHGRPLRMVLRAALAAGLSVAALALIPGQPGEPVAVTLMTLWFVLTARSDLAPPPSR